MSDKASLSERYPETAALENCIAKFEKWVRTTGYASYDPYDLWGTGYGLKSRALYYRKHPLGLALIAPLIAIDIAAPGVRSCFVEKERFATADAQLILAFLNLFRCTGDSSYITEARKLGEEMLGYSIPGYSGYCWGYPFDWQNPRGMWVKNTPYITCTPYCFEAYLGLHEITGEERYFDIARSIAKFVHDDLKEISTGSDSAAGSYSPKDSSQVVNAGAYRAMVLFEAAARFQEERYAESARRNLNYILQAQREDGSWLYATDGHGNFIDHFHTCFVLKNLCKIYNRVPEAPIDKAIRKGWEYYRAALFDKDDLPKSFAIEPRTQLVKLEMCNMAEAITLGSLLRSAIPGALDLATRLAEELYSKYQLPQGYFVTRVFKTGVRHKFPFLRWPQAQLFYSLTNLLVARRPKTEERAAVAA